jgi:hypothetical protein
VHPGPFLAFDRSALADAAVRLVRLDAAEPRPQNVHFDALHKRESVRHNLQKNIVFIGI